MVFIFSSILTHFLVFSTRKSLTSFYYLYAPFFN